MQRTIIGRLKRLDIDYIDLYQLHFPDTSTPFEVSLETLLKAQEQGKIRYFGVSNYTVDQKFEGMRASMPIFQSDVQL